jgi:mono/diheme cytochrome c family protein
MRELSAAVVIAAVVALVTVTVFAVRDDDGAGESTVASEVPAGTVALTSAELYVRSGCAACHGANGEGGVGPALAGHTTEQVIRQARRPLNVMPLFTSEELSDGELELVAAFIGELEMEEMGHQAHDEGAEGQVDPRDEITMHHWMALSALRAGNGDAAVAHIAGIIDAVGGEHEAAMLEASEAIESGDFARGEALVLEMLAGFVPELTDQQILVRLALQALAVDDTEEAIADLEAAIESADAEHVDELEAAIESLREGHVDEAQELLEPLSGLLAHEEEEEEEEEDHDE